MATDTPDIVGRLNVDEVERIIETTEPAELSDRADRIWTRRMAVALANVFNTRLRTALAEAEAREAALLMNPMAERGRATPMSNNGWFPIETAPKDGTRVLLWMVHANAKYSKAPAAEGWEAPVVAEWIDHNGGGWTWHGLCGSPTHWRPLPAAPAKEEDNG